jgi:hypothetical protein
VRAHLDERKFRAKPFRHCGAAGKRQPGRGGIVRRTPLLPETRAVRPDERYIGTGRERPPPTGPWGEEGGMAEGVAHAPDASFAAADSGVDGDAGGTVRRPDCRGEVVQTEGHQHVDLTSAMSILPSVRF